MMKCTESGDTGHPAVVSTVIEDAAISFCAVNAPASGLVDTVALLKKSDKAVNLSSLSCEVVVTPCSVR